jgi:hypothetical protein
MLLILLGAAAKRKSACGPAGCWLRSKKTTGHGSRPSVPPDPAFEFLLPQGV